MEQSSHFESLYPETAREEEIGKIINLTKEGSSLQLIGIPGGGRSTVLLIIANNKKVRQHHLGDLSEKYHFISVNFSEIRKRPLFDAMKFLFLALNDSLRERGWMSEYEKSNTYFKEALKFHDELVLFQALKEAIDFLCLEKKLNLIFLFDRFEEYVPYVTSEFFTNMRALRTRVKYQFSIVFSLNRPLESLLQEEILSDYHEFVSEHIVYLSLRDDVTTNFRIKYIERITGKKLSDSIHSAINFETGGVGKLTKLAVENLLTLPKLPENPKIGEYLFSQKSIKEALSEICRSLNPEEQECLIQENFENKEAVDYLECIGILHNNKIQIPLFEQHIRSHAEDINQKPKKIIFDLETNTIKMGQTVLSDKLTSLEFKLLSFLIQNPESIIDREKLIAVVWSDVKSTAGITDQAIDQLIFRLRRKIETDPNRPTHLQTVKGRGFKFVS